jgi:hypothetical protein
MAVINVRKARAGTDSAGHRWAADGAVIAVPVEHALALTRIPDGGFSIIETLVEDQSVALAATEAAEVVAGEVDESGPEESGAKRAARTSARRS